jgi:DNA-binding transcriptional LysR family regulator
MEIRELRAFVAVVDEGGVSAAARRLHVSQSALSQTMRSLESQVGGALLVRDHHGARPTELGRRLLGDARALVEQHDRLVSTLTGATDAGELRVGVPLELPPDLLPSAIAAVRAEHPDVRVLIRHARSTDQLVELKAGKLELALVRDRPADPRLDSVLAVEEPMGVILTATRAEQWCDDGAIRLQRLTSLAWIGFARSDAPAWHDQVRATLRSHGVAGADPAVDADRPVPPEVKLAAVATGRAFALASPSWGQPLPDGLSWYPLTGAPLVRRTWAVWPADARHLALATLVSALDLTGR